MKDQCVGAAAIQVAENLAPLQPGMPLGVFLFVFSIVAILLLALFITLVCWALHCRPATSTTSTTSIVSTISTISAVSAPTTIPTVPAL